ncbi:APC family permease [Nocardia vaccinii]|uniref:APC family permease n=1 Tax=Nocardia vaccinii TaxID=1822 RepID=UPI0009FD32FA|nr:APC family permease [Nocardia vaccinii]
MTIESPPATPDPASSSDTGPTRLSGKLGVTPLVLSVLAFSAPIVTVSGYIAFTISFAGPQAPLAYLLATVILLVFAVGFTVMTKHIPRPGAFYAYISTGLGRVPGLGAAFLAVISYMMIMAGLYCFTGVTLSSLIENFGGPSTPWWVWSLASWAVVSVLGYFHVELSAKVLSVVMVFEVVLVMIFNIPTLGKGGAQGLSTEPFNPMHFSHGDLFVALLFAFMNFIGFEATALYRDEVRQPSRTIPRATYLSVIFIGIFYCLSCYALISAYGSSALSVAQKNPSNMFNLAVDRFISNGFSKVSMVLVTTSSIAALLSTHNVIARYIHNLASDRAIPFYFAAVHKRHLSPYRASVASAVIVVLALVPFVLAGTDTGVLYGALGGLGSTGVMILMALVSLAVFVWFVRNGVPSAESKWKVWVAPILAFLLIAVIVVFAMKRFDLVVGGSPGQNLWMVAILIGTLLAGSLLAVFFRYARPRRYQALGRADRGADEIAESVGGTEAVSG